MTALIIAAAVMFFNAAGARIMWDEPMERKIDRACGWLIAIIAVIFLILSK